MTKLLKVLLIVGLIVLVTALPAKERLPNVQLIDDETEEHEVYFQFPLLYTDFDFTELGDQMMIKGDDRESFDKFLPVRENTLITASTPGASNFTL